jgi:RNA polymerase sigma-70 factor, ECF subfamily
MFFKKSKISGSAAEMTEETASKELKNGSRAAFDFLYECYGRKVYVFCLRMLGDEEVAKDVFQETFVKIFEKRKEFHGENFPAWAFTIARHACLNAIRSKRSFDEIDENDRICDNLNNEDVQMREFIEQSLQKLPVAYREVLVLREYQECSYQEIAEILGIELANVKIRVHRARTLMRKLLTPIAKEYYEH